MRLPRLHLRTRPTDAVAQWWARSPRWTKAVVVLAPGVDHNRVRETIAARCRERLADYKVPRLIEVSDRLEPTPAQKMARAPLDG